MHYICEQEMDEHKCWKRKGHEGPCMTVIPNKDPKITTRPLVVRW